jgi:hypothetical protein
MDSTAKIEMSLVTHPTPRIRMAEPAFMLFKRQFAVALITVACSVIRPSFRCEYESQPFHVLLNSRMFSSSPRPPNSPVAIIWFPFSTDLNGPS